MTTISSVNSMLVQANTGSPSATPGVSAVKTVTTAATPTPANTSTVKVSAAGLTVLKAATATPAPMTVAQALAAGADIPAGTVIKDTAAAVGANLKALAGLASLSNIASITLSDTKAGTVSLSRADLGGDLTSSTNTDKNLAVLKKITSSYTLNITNLAVSDALTLKPPAKAVTLSLAMSDTVDNITSNLTALQAAAKAKSIASIALSSATAGTPKPSLSLSVAQFKASPELLATIKGDYDLTITGVAAADAVTLAGNADKVLKASGSLSTQSKIAISDASANLVKSIAALETAATAGRLTSITVSDNKALVLTEAQIKADSHFLATQFTSNTAVEATAVAAADVTTVQSLVNANSKLTLTKESIADTAANIQGNLDALEANVKSGGLTPTLTIPARSTISPTPPAPLGPNQIYNPANGHVYEYVAHTGISWEDAKAEADAKIYAGAKGYLTTITNQEELDFIENSVLPNHNNDGNVYIGGHLVSGSTSKWQWADGPENGTIFWDNGAVQGQFANWNTSSAYPRTGSEATNAPAVTLNSYFVPQFASAYGTAINSLSAGGNGGYVVEYSEFNTAPTPTPTPKVNPIISNISVTDKGSITVTNSTLVNDIDALKVLTGKYTLNVTDTGVTDALALKAPSKDAALVFSIKDTAANIGANWDKLEAAAKAKTLSAITVTDSASSLLTMTAAQLKSDADALKLVVGDYKLAVTGVLAADVAKTLTTKNIYSVEVKDSAANILKNLAAIQTAVTAAKIQTVVITDTTNPSLSISDIFVLTTTLPNVTLASGVKFNVKDTASTIIAHARDDIADVLKNAATVTLTDKTTPNLTLADATTLKSLTNLAKGTKYNVMDGGGTIATQAAIAGETILSGAASVVINKNFTINDAKAVTGLKTLVKGTMYSITDTADNILSQSAVAGDKILVGANTVTVVDTSANILAKLDQLETLAKAGKIADIKFTDTPSGTLTITNDQLVKDAEAIGKIISQRTLPQLNITTPVTPTPLGSTGSTIQSGILSFNINLPNNTQPALSGISSDVTKAWGNYTDQSNKQHAFIIKTDGTGLIDLTPQGATQSNISGISSDVTKAWGNYTDQSNKQHAFIIKTDGTGFLDLTSQNMSASQIDGSNEEKTFLWGQFAELNGQPHGFIMKTDGSGFTDVTPQNSSATWIKGISSDGTKIWGQFNAGDTRNFIMNIDGSGFVDLEAPGAKSSSVNSISKDGKKASGIFVDQNNKHHAFIINTDGTGFVDLTPQGATQSGVSGFLLDGTKVWGVFSDHNDQQVHPFICNIDGSNFVDLTPNGSTFAFFNGATPDGSKVWGASVDQNGKSQNFIIRSDNSSLVNFALNDAVSSNVLGSTSNNHIYGIYQKSDQKWYGFLFVN